MINKINKAEIIYKKPSNGLLNEMGQPLDFTLKKIMYNFFTSIMFL